MVGLYSRGKLFISWLPENKKRGLTFIMKLPPLNHYALKLPVDSFTHGGSPPRDSNTEYCCIGDHAFQHKTFWEEHLKIHTIIIYFQIFFPPFWRWSYVAQAGLELAILELAILLFSFLSAGSIDMYYHVCPIFKYFNI